MRIGQAIVAVVKIPVLCALLLTGCVARPLGDLEPVSGYDMGGVDIANCGIPSDEKTAAAASLIWDAFGASGHAPKIAWSCDCLAVEGSSECGVYSLGDPLRIMWTACFFEGPRRRPDTIGDSCLRYALAAQANVRPSPQEFERLRQLLNEAGL